MKNRAIVAFALLVFGAASQCGASEITYYVNLAIGAGSATGDIVTDGTIGTLSTSDIVSWNLLVNDGASAYDMIPSDSSVGFTNGSPTATATQLLFTFTDPDNPNLVTGLIYFEAFTPAFDIITLCFEGSSGCGYVTTYEPEISISGYNVINNSRVEQYVPISGTDVIASASAAAATPEPSSFILLLAGLAGTAGLVRRKLRV